MAAKTIDHETLAAFFGDIAALISSGMTTEETVGMLAQEAQPGILKNALTQALGAIEAGEPLSAALGASGSFPQYALRMTAAAEASGRLEETAASLCRYYEKRAAMSRMISQVMLQPLVMLFFLCVIMGLFIGMILPLLAGVYDAMGGDAAIYITGAYIVAASAFAVILAALIALFVMWVCFKTGRGKNTLAKVWQNSLPTRAAALLFAKAQLMADAQTRIAGGIMPEQAIESAAESIANASLKKCAKRCAQRIAHGQSAGEVIYEEKLLPPACCHVIISGTRSGTLEQAFARAAEMLSSDAEACAGSLTMSAEPLLTGFFTIAVGVCLISIILPLIGIMTAMV